MKKFTNESMYEIIEYFENTLFDKDIVSFEVLNPDICVNKYSGTTINSDEEYIYRSYKSWTDLAELMFCKMLTPIITSKYTVVLNFKKIDVETSFHKDENSSNHEKYGCCWK